MKILLLLSLTLLVGCTRVSGTVTETRPDGTVIKADGAYLAVLQTKKIEWEQNKEGLKKLGYNTNSDPAVELAKEAFKAGLDAGKMIR